MAEHSNDGDDKGSQIGIMNLPDSCIDGTTVYAAPENMGGTNLARFARTVEGPRDSFARRLPDRDEGVE